MATPVPPLFESIRVAIEQGDARALPRLLKKADAPGGPGRPPLLDPQRFPVRLLSLFDRRQTGVIRVLVEHGFFPADEAEELLFQVLEDGNAQLGDVLFRHWPEDLPLKLPGDRLPNFATLDWWVDHNLPFDLGRTALQQDADGTLPSLPDAFRLAQHWWSWWVDSSGGQQLSPPDFVEKWHQWSASALVPLSEATRQAWIIVRQKDDAKALVRLQETGLFAMPESALYQVIRNGAARILPVIWQIATPADHGQLRQDWDQLSDHVVHYWKDMVHLNGADSVQDFLQALTALGMDWTHRFDGGETIVHRMARAGYPAELITPVLQGWPEGLETPNNRGRLPMEELPDALQEAWQAAILRQSLGTTLPAGLRTPPTRRL
jgi:hypothetical protein